MSNVFDLQIPFNFTKREYMTTIILSGIVANPDMRMDSALAAKFAVRYADNLLEELNEQSKSE